MRKEKLRMKSLKEVVAGVKEKASPHGDAKATARRTVGQSDKRNWDCSQIENEEEKEEDDW